MTTPVQWNVSGSGIEYRGICPCGRGLRSDGARGPNVTCTNCGKRVKLKAVGT